MDSKNNGNFKKVIDIVNKFKSNYKLKTKTKTNSFKETNILRIENNMAKKKLHWSPRLNFNESLNYVISYEKSLKQKKNPYEICLYQINEYVKGL